MIDQATIDRIFDTSRIEDVVSDFVALKKRGVNLIGLCPFHNEKTPSFTVSPSKNICKCFGCGKGGNPINFLMELEQLSYPDALHYLAKKYNIEIEETVLSEEQKRMQNDRESMLIVNEYAQKIFMEQLHNSDEGINLGLSYLRERGFREDIILKFQLGYCLEQRDAFTQKALEAGYNLKYLESTGLTIVREDYKVDRFKGRILFPIHGIAGKIIGFGGRILKRDEKAAKYLNSPDSLIYHKGTILYGLYYAKQSMTKLDNCFVVEGYTDVVSMHQAGVENVVASSGTAFTPDQVRLIKRFTSNITMIFDGDNAGINASTKGIDLVLKEGMNVKVLPLPDGEDPDTFFKKMSATEFNTYMQQHRVDFIHFKASLLLGEAKNDPVKRANMISDIIRSIAIIPDTIIRSVYIKECNRLLGIDEQSIYDQIKKTNNQSSQEQQVQVQLASASLQHEFDLEEKNLVRILMKYGNHPKSEEETNIGNYLIDELKADLIILQNPLYQKVFEEYSTHSQEANLDTERFFTMHQDPTLSQLASDLLSEAHQISKIFTAGSIANEHTQIEHLASKAILEYKLRYIEKDIKEAMNNMKEAQKEKNETLLMENMSYLQELKYAHQEIMKLLGGRIYS